MKTNKNIKKLIKERELESKIWRILYVTGIILFFIGAILFATTNDLILMISGFALFFISINNYHRADIDVLYLKASYKMKMELYDENEEE